MKVYVAGAYAARDVLRDHVVPALVAAGHTVTSSWLGGTRPISVGTVGTSPDSPQQAVDEFVRGDLADIYRADVLVQFTGDAMIALDPLLAEAPLHTGGRHVELGYALALGRPVVVVGELENVFQRCTEVRKAETITAALARLAEIERDCADQEEVLRQFFNG